MDYLTVFSFLLNSFFSLRKHVHGNSTTLVKNFQHHPAGLEFLIPEVGLVFQLWDYVDFRLSN